MANRVGRSRDISRPETPRKQTTQEDFPPTHAGLDVLIVLAMFSSFSAKIPFFGIWADGAQNRESRAAAFAVLQCAAAVCDEQDVRTPEVEDALSALEARALRHGPFRQFRAALNYPNPQVRQEAACKALSGIAKALGLTSNGALDQRALSCNSTE